MADMIWLSIVGALGLTAQTPPHRITCAEDAICQEKCYNLPIVLVADGSYPPYGSMTWLLFEDCLIRELTPAEAIASILRRMQPGVTALKAATVRLNAYNICRHDRRWWKIWKPRCKL
jgi:hypothetical protein